MAENMRQLPAVTRWAGEQGAQFVIVSHMLAYDAAMLGQSLFNANTPNEVRALRGVSLAIDEGSFVVVIGTNENVFTMNDWN